MHNFSGAVSHRTRISGQLQTRGGARFDCALEREGVPYNAASALNDAGAEVAGQWIGNQHVPDETLVVLYFEFLTNWDGDVKHGERASDIEEQGSKGEMSAGTSPLVKHRGSENGHCQIAVPSAHLLPDPNTISSGFPMELSSFPSFKNRSGSYV